MEGYSVTEAASVLGVPTERVWELLARGVLSGTPDGETGMRVFLQPRPAPAPTPLDHARADTGAAARPDPAGELSPFRELLTEFRNLTERYGQALLALGEARGEVATLRSRVDLLEARIDLRLPPPAPAAWPEPRAEPVDHAGGSTDRVVGTATPAQDEEEHEPRRRKRKGRATENFAEALARAEDPTAPELRPAGDAAPDRAGMRSAPPDAATAPEPAPETVLPRELPAAESIDLAPEPVSVPPEAPQVPAPGQEPVIDDATDAVEEPEVRTQPAGESPTVERDPQEAPQPDGEPAPDVQAAPQPEPENDAGLPVISAEPPPVDAAPLAAQQPLAPVTAGPGAEAAATVADRPPIDWDPERYTVEVAEPDWLEAEDDPPPTSTPEDPDVAQAAAEEGEADVPAAADPRAAPQPTGEDPARAADGEPQRSPSERPVAPWPSGGAPARRDEETMLWFGRRPPIDSAEQTGGDEMEVAGSASPSPVSRPSPAGLPGGTELHEALSALEALARGAGPQPPQPFSQPEPAATGPEGPGPTRADDAPWAPPSAPEAPAPSPAPAPVPAPSTPATRAYRRLRRIFPG